MKVEGSVLGPLPQALSAHFPLEVAAVGDSWGYSSN